MDRLRRVRVPVLTRLHTETSWGAIDIHLLSVGRDGDTVTVVNWGAMGDFGDAPVPTFKKTTVTLSKLW